MRALNAGLRRVVVGGLLAGGVVVSGLVVTGSSYSVFSSTTANAPDAWSAGTVTLTDDDSNVAMFTVTGMKPGSTGTKCIQVTSNGTLPSTVKLYKSLTSPTYATTNALATYINLTVTQGTGGTTANCGGFTPLPSNSAVFTGTLAGFASTATDFASGLPATGTWAPTGTGSEARSYQFTYTLDSAAPNTTQNGTATIGFTWEAQNS